MSVLSRIGASIGIGNLSVGIKTSARICIGETLQGTVSITGGKVPQTAQALWVGIRLAWETTDEDGNTQSHHTVLLKRPYDFAATVAPGQSQQINFGFVVPASLELARTDHWHEVFAEVDIVSGVDVTGTSFIRVYPARPVGELVQAVVDRLGWGLGGIDLKHSPRGALRAIFVPSEALTARFDRLVLDISHSGSGWQLGAMVDLKEGLWRALTKQDEHRAELKADSVESAIQQLGAFVTQWATPA